MKKYENILFDLDMTLLDFKSCEYNALKKTFEEYGVNIDGKTHELYSLINDGLWKRLERGEINKNDLGTMRFKEFLEKMKIERDADEVNEKYKENLSLQAILMDGAKEVCQSLYEDYNLYVITNGTDWIQRSRLQLSSLSEFVKRMITSDEAGTPKPKKEFFDFFFKKTKLDKSTCLIVGDSITSDILGGVNYGIDTCLICQKEPDGEIRPDYTLKNIRFLINLLQQIS